MNDRPSMRPARAKLLLFVVNDPAFFLSHRLNVALAARAQGYEVRVATPPSVEAERVRAAGFAHIEIPLDRYSGNLFKEAITLCSLARLYRRVAPDVIHHVTIKPVLYGSLAARVVSKAAVVNAVSGLGQVFTASGVWGSARRVMVERLYRLAFRRRKLKVIFQNRDDRRRFVERGLVEEAQTVLIPGAGVDTERFAPRPEPSSAVTVMFASRLLHEKGVGEFIGAAALLKQRGSKARFVVVGAPVPGNPGSVTSEELERWRADGHVEFWGTRDDMPKTLAQAHIFCLPSYYGEGIPKALIEAAASGLPLVTADTAGCRDIVRHDSNGFVVTPRDPVALAAALERLIENDELRRTFGRSSRALVLEEGFSDQQVVDRTLDVYASLMAEGAALRN